MIFEHKSVLLNEVIDSLELKKGGIYVDGTLGGGGHAFELLSREETATLIGIDQDEAAIAAATDRLKIYADRVNIIRDNYVNIENILAGLDIDKVDGIYLDLGVSSHQLDNEERGFSYRFDSPLDMRMDKRKALSAKDVVNDYSMEELARILRLYGEEMFAQNIAKHIVLYREKKKIETTGELLDIIKAAIPMKMQLKSKHPAKRTFQAIRIEVNRELEVLENSLAKMIDLLKPGAVLAVITFHSLEDRMVKQLFKKYENPCTCPKNFPICVCGNESKGRAVTRKALVASAEELELNSRAKSAKLRVFKRGGKCEE